MMASEEYRVKFDDYVDIFIKHSANRTIQDWYSAARASKRLTDWAAACLRARRCTDVPMLRGLI